MYIEQSISQEVPSHMIMLGHCPKFDSIFILLEALSDHHLMHHHRTGNI